jgi:hypothetical protein
VCRVAAWQGLQRDSSGDLYRLSWHPQRSHVPDAVVCNGGPVIGQIVNITAGAL